jgi:GNAT superfamily N-acetyltransferase
MDVDPYYLTLFQAPDALRSLPEVSLQEISASKPPSDADIELLCTMRIACGRGLRFVDGWVKDICAGNRYMYFIHLGPSTDGEAVGMIGIDLLCPKDPDFSSRGKPLEVGNIFVYEKYRHIGVGEAAHKVAEIKARELGAKKIILDMPVVFDYYAVRRYVRMGYKEYKRGIIYAVEDAINAGYTTDDCFGIFMEKEIWFHCWLDTVESRQVAYIGIFLSVSFEESTYIGCVSPP